MHLVLLHGYLLHGTGSNIYVANIAKAWCQLGHQVTVVCQDRQPQDLPFVREYIGPQEKIPAVPPEPGTVRVVVPFINDLLPVYVLDKYEGYQVKRVPEMIEDEIQAHIEMTASTLSEVCAQGVDSVLTNHALFGPIIAKRALQNTDISYDVKIHGSAIEYVLVPFPNFMKYAVEGLSGARKIFVGTQYVENRVLEVFAAEREQLHLDQKLRIVSPGMDPDVFTLANNFETTHDRFVKKVKAMIQQNNKGRRHRKLPSPDGKTAEEFHHTLLQLSETYDQRATDADLLERWPELREDEPIIIYFGKFLKEKGVGELLALVLTMLLRIPEARFIFVGFGSYREHLEGIIQAFEEGDPKLAAACARAGNFIEEVDMNKLFRQLSAEEQNRISITGILDHDTLSELLPLASLAIVPSKLAEAFGMVAVEAMAAGVLPLCNYHSGLRDVVDELRTAFPELNDIFCLDHQQFIEELPGNVEKALHYLYPLGFKDQGKRKRIGRQLRQFAVANFSWQGIAKKLLSE